MSRARVGVRGRLRAIADARGTLWLLVRRDLKVRYADSWLGYLWSILDPLLMSLIYWFVFTEIFQRSVGREPYLIFLLSALLPWVWFQNSVNDSVRALRSQAKLVRSTAIPREIWALRVVVAKGIEFSFSIPVLALFMIFYPPQFDADIWLFPAAIVIQFVLLTGLSLILAPVAVLVRDLEPLVRIGMRALFYASPVIYGIEDFLEVDLPAVVQSLYMLNPMAGILTAYRGGLFDGPVAFEAVGVAAVVSTVTLGVGIWIFSRLENAMLKEM